MPDLVASETWLPHALPIFCSICLAWSVIPIPNLRPWNLSNGFVPSPARGGEYFQIRPQQSNGDTSLL
jgi:hypothetical protein